MLTQVVVWINRKRFRARKFHQQILIWQSCYKPSLCICPLLVNRTLFYVNSRTNNRYVHHQNNYKHSETPKIPAMSCHKYTTYTQNPFTSLHAQRSQPKIHIHPSQNVNLFCSKALLKTIKLILHAHSFQTTFYSFNHLNIYPFYTYYYTKNKSNVVLCVFLWVYSAWLVKRTYILFHADFSIITSLLRRPIPDSSLKQLKGKQRNSETYTYTHPYTIHTEIKQQKPK